MSRITDRLNKNKGYLNRETTLKMVQESFAKLKQPEQLAAQTGVGYDTTEKEFIIPFLNRKIHVRYPSGEVYQPGGGDISIDYKILVLHYLKSSQGTPLKNKWISFKELPSGQIYITPFHNRAIRPLVAIFGEQPEQMVKAGLTLGGETGEIGDASVIIPVLPLVPVAYVIWRGDEEFPPSGNVLFDESAPDHLPTEDYAVLASGIVFEMKRIISQS